MTGFCSSNRPVLTLRRLNKIENAFARLKAGLRKAVVRTIPELWTVIGRILPTFTQAECANYFTAVGYEPE